MCTSTSIISWAHCFSPYRFLCLYPLAQYFIHLECELAGGNNLGTSCVERGTWWWVGIVIIFGHFLIPFLALLRIDVKARVLVHGAALHLGWLMPFRRSILTFCLSASGRFPAAMASGCMSAAGRSWEDSELAIPQGICQPSTFPLKDPRLVRRWAFFHPVPTQISGGELDQTDDLRDAPPAIFEEANEL